MKKSELVTNLAGRFPGLTRREVEVSVATMLKAIREELVSGGRLEVRRFGVLSTHVHVQKRGRNPRTGEFVFVPARRAVHFRPSKRLLSSTTLEAPEGMERHGALAEPTDAHSAPSALREHRGAGCQPLL